MSTETEYTVFRRDARSSIVFDSASPLKTLQSLVQKAQEEYEQAFDEFNNLAARVDAKEKQVDELKNRLHKFEVALDVARKALGPEDDE